MPTIREASIEDSADIAALLNEVDEFYGDTPDESSSARVAQVKEMLFRAPPAAYVILACEDAETVGFASYSFLWPAAGSTRSLFLKELFVTKSRQRTGVGRNLMHRIHEIAADSGCTRVEWATEKSNSGAVEFYEKLGFGPNREKLLYRSTGLSG